MELQRKRERRINFRGSVASLGSRPAGAGPEGYWNSLDRHTDLREIWMSHPLVRRRINLLITGEENQWPTAWLNDLDIPILLVITQDEPLNRLIAQSLCPLPVEVRHAANSFIAGEQLVTLKITHTIIDFRHQEPAARLIWTHIDPHLHPPASKLALTNRDTAQDLFTADSNVLQTPFDQKYLLEHLATITA